jgi:hypothetical protein
VRAHQRGAVGAAAGLLGDGRPQAPVETRSRVPLRPAGDAWISDTLCDWIMPMKSTLIRDSLFLPCGACRR